LIIEYDIRDHVNVTDEILKSKWFNQMLEELTIYFDAKRTKKSSEIPMTVYNYYNNWNEKIEKWINGLDF